MMGGEHIFLYKLILGSEINVASIENKDKEKERFLAMCYFMRADEKRYGELHNEFKKGVFRVRDEYLVTVSDAYQVLLRTPSQIGYQSNSRVTGNRFWGVTNRSPPTTTTQKIDP